MSFQTHVIKSYLLKKNLVLYSSYQMHTDGCYIWSQVHNLTDGKLKKIRPVQFLK